MLSQCLVFDKQGLVLSQWSTTGKIDTAPVNAFVTAVLVDETAPADGSYTSGSEIVRYTRASGATIAVTHSSLLQPKGVDALLSELAAAWSAGAELGPLLDSYESSKTRQQDKEQLEQAEETLPKPAAKPVAKKGAKKGRKWGDDGMYYDDNEDSGKLDFSNAKEGGASAAKSANLDQLVGTGYGSKAKDGKFIISDYHSAADDASDAASNKTGFLSKVWSQYVGGGIITEEEFASVRGKIIEHLVKKNVSNSVCESLMDEIKSNVVGQRRANFTSLETIIKEEMSKKLRKLLTPTISINLLDEIESKRPDPYVISVVGVNGVGKSTNLSKLAYWLLQNNYKVLIAACDTFRSGAVEQLRVHVNNLSQLSSQKIELFELGYGGKDLVSKIARGAIQHAKDNGFDVILMDTAGRRHNDTQLMAPLESFAKVAQPDKIIMVGEALVGSDAVMQAQNFNKAFGKGKTLDAFIVSKCDTVGGQLGSIVDLVWASRVPVLFVGVGQTYTDLRVLSVEWVIGELLK